MRRGFMKIYSVILYIGFEDETEEFKFQAETKEEAREYAEELMINYDAFDYKLEEVNE